MSFIDSEKRETLWSSASIESFEIVLVKNGFKTTRTQYGVSGTKGGAFSTNGKIDTITVRDVGNHRECECVSTAKGLLLSPHTNVLAPIVSEAESIEKNK